ncbi:hypothetical protein scyTo_0025752 [Scyliorhinus torazame]|uniref:Uncharacterized protein n=1 Tax=Scyliorhinus torazame TaxID=75743 RepID=A0A401QI98_SCYTO|nr:hypothetical protein [Scyliorhinus torazame]
MRDNTQGRKHGGYTGLQLDAPSPPRREQPCPGQKMDLTGRREKTRSAEGWFQERKGYKGASNSMEGRAQKDGSHSLGNHTTWNNLLRKRKAIFDELSEKGTSDWGVASDWEVAEGSVPCENVADTRVSAKRMEKNCNFTNDCTRCSRYALGGGADHRGGGCKMAPVAKPCRSLKRRRFRKRWKLMQAFHMLLYRRISPLTFHWRIWNLSRKRRVPQPHGAKRGSQSDGTGQPADEGSESPANARPREWGACRKYPEEGKVFRDGRPGAAGPCSDSRKEARSPEGNEWLKAASRNPSVRLLGPSPAATCQPLPKDPRLVGQAGALEGAGKRSAASVPLRGSSPADSTEKPKAASSASVQTNSHGAPGLGRKLAGMDHGENAHQAQGARLTGKLPLDRGHPLYSRYVARQKDAPQVCRDEAGGDMSTHGSSLFGAQEQARGLPSGRTKPAETGVSVGQIPFSGVGGNNVFGERFGTLYWLSG